MDAQVDAARAYGQGQDHAGGQGIGFDPPPLGEVGQERAEGKVDHRREHGVAAGETRVAHHHRVQGERRPGAIENPLEDVQDDEATKGRGDEQPQRGPGPGTSSPGWRVPTPMSWPSPCTPSGAVRESGRPCSASSTRR